MAFLAVNETMLVGQRAALVRLVAKSGCHDVRCRHASIDGGGAASRGSGLAGAISEAMIALGPSQGRADLGGTLGRVATTGREHDGAAHFAQSVFAIRERQFCWVSSPEKQARAPPPLQRVLVVEVLCTRHLLCLLSLD